MCIIVLFIPFLVDTIPIIKECFKFCNLSTHGHRDKSPSFVNNGQILCPKGLQTYLVMRKLKPQHAFSNEMFINLFSFRTIGHYGATHRPMY